MCDKKNKVLFTDTEYLVLFPEFKLPDENQVLLRIPRQNNMYNFNLENIAPSGGLACLIAKATIDESNKWHRRLCHVNFKNLNKLVKGNLVRGLPSKIFQNDHTCVACQKGKQHKASLIDFVPTLAFACLLGTKLSTLEALKGLILNIHGEITLSFFTTFDYMGVGTEFEVTGFDKACDSSILGIALDLGRGVRAYSFGLEEEGGFPKIDCFEKLGRCAGVVAFACVVELVAKGLLKICAYDCYVPCSVLCWPWQGSVVVRLNLVLQLVVGPLGALVNLGDCDSGNLLLDVGDMTSWEGCYCLLRNISDNDRVPVITSECMESYLAKLADMLRRAWLCCAMVISELDCHTPSSTSRIPPNLDDGKISTLLQLLELLFQDFHRLFHKIQLSINSDLIQRFLGGWRCGLKEEGNGLQEGLDMYRMRGRVKQAVFNYSLLTTPKTGFLAFPDLPSCNSLLPIHLESKIWKGKEKKGKGERIEMVGREEEKEGGAEEKKKNIEQTPRIMNSQTDNPNDTGFATAASQTKTGLWICSALNLFNNKSTLYLTYIAFNILLHAQYHQYLPL
ncbi:ribonuclease H-like domain-containing protein [Tanacetum coccineum]